MSKKNKDNFETDDDWEGCPVCGRSIKSKNLDRHLKKVHPEMSNKDIKEKMKSPRGKSRYKSSNKAERRKDMLKEKRRRNDLIIFSVMIIAISGIIGGYFLSVSGGDNNDDSDLDIQPEPTQQAPAPTTKNEVRIPVSEVNDGDAHFYKYNSRGVDIRYFVLKSSDGVIRAAFDTCDVCYDAKRGYRQEGDDMVCNNCGQRFASVKINVEKGGCNPAPLTRKVDGSELVIKTDDIETGRWYFD